MFTHANTNIHTYMEIAIYTCSCAHVHDRNMYKSTEAEEGHTHEHTGRCAHMQLSTKMHANTLVITKTQTCRQRHVCHVHKTHIVMAHV